MEKNIKRNTAFIIISIIGIILSAYILTMHYEEGPSICQISKSFNCDIVSKSEYSTIDGFINWMIPEIYAKLPIPNALLSLLVFIFILISNSFAIKNKSTISNKVNKTTKILMIISIIYAAWLIYIEAYVLRTWCLFCIMLDAVILITLSLTIYNKGEENGTKMQ